MKSKGSSLGAVNHLGPNVIVPKIGITIVFAYSHLAYSIAVNSVMASLSSGATHNGLSPFCRRHGQLFMWSICVLNILRNPIFTISCDSVILSFELSKESNDSREWNFAIELTHLKFRETMMHKLQCLVRQSKALFNIL